MRKNITLAALLILLAVGATAQNSFKGIVKYKIESTGQVDFEVKDELSSAEIKVMGNDMYTESPIFIVQKMMTNPIYQFCRGFLVQNMKSRNLMDFSMLVSYLTQDGAEFTYQGDGKLIIDEDATTGEFDSVELVDTEAGHFYYEYVDGETQTIAGQTAKKIIRHYFDDDGVDHPTVMWYTDAIGPKLNPLFIIKGMPLQYTVELGEGRAITYTATEIKKGGVKEVDFLLPAGYDKMSDEDLELFFKELGEEMELRSDE